MNRNEILKYYNKHAWQPFTQMKLAGDPEIIASAEKAYLTTPEGRRIIDAIGSWWTVIHGHNHPVIRRAIQNQYEKLDHVMYAGFTHEPAAILSQILSETTNHKLPRVFFSDNGSTAVEIACKMAFQYFANKGRTEKKGFVALQNGYHGDTIGTMSVGARSVFHKVYEPLLFDTHLVQAPRVPFKTMKNEQRTAKALAPALQQITEVIEKNHNKLCAVILEPLIQGSGGMNIYPALYLKKVRELCDRYDLFMIADEVFTGMGRTGTFYACEQAEIWPDIMALSKGLSAGYIPFAATLATEKIYKGFYSANRMHTFFHGHSMTANPPGCAAAIASISLFAKENRMDDVKRVEKFHHKNLKRIADGPLGKQIKEVRHLGTVAAIELDIETNYTDEFGWQIRARALEQGILIRPLGNVVYMTPPYVISNEELIRVYGVIEEVLREVLWV